MKCKNHATCKGIAEAGHKLCPECQLADEIIEVDDVLELLGQVKNDDRIADGFGQSVSAWCNECGRKSIQVVRPGVFRCGHCGRMA